MKRIIAIMLIAGGLFACGDNDDKNRIENKADSTNNLPAPDTSMSNTDSANGRNNPNRNQDSLRYN
ncbi:hypothetical protein [Paraflavitalea sp. CAU 1676]|uniref:hypothetical protein n=1 Tax=Paraflavitalea sp. CAU 1676 TaxID=3032598 RepID=UPI0023DAD00D|nr:hypothetical protein [Paraflavitalea sp. CAU 1676]MDF2191096.1 hypothetical protein [Paraflavitalea sp. CAU 1676]